MSGDRTVEVTSSASEYERLERAGEDAAGR